MKKCANKKSHIFIFTESIGPLSNSNQRDVTTSPELHARNQHHQEPLIPASSQNNANIVYFDRLPYQIVHDGVNYRLVLIGPDRGELKNKIQS